MNILLESRAFYPSIGGLEMMAQELASAWLERGHQVHVVTSTPLADHTELSDLQVTRSPSSIDWIQEIQWADVFFQNGVSLRSIGYAVLMGCPIIYRHPDILKPREQGFDVRNELKRCATAFGCNVVSSKAVAEPVLGPSVHIPNTFRPIFRNVQTSGKAERSGLLFVGRLVSVKGVDVAIDALERLHDRGIKQTLTVCGDGPDKGQLAERVRRSGLSDFVSFKGWTRPDELVSYYSKAEVTLVPSRYEPFGIVALEAIACGCPVVASSVDGLPEAIGDCGILVPPDDAEALGNAIERALQPDIREALQTPMPSHVDRHRIDRIATDYLHVLRRVARRDD